MLEAIRKKANRKLQQVKENPVIRQYLKYIAISILLGVGFKYCYDGFISLIEPFLDILHISSVSSIDNSYLFSATATILATIFTIIFVLLTFFVQVSDISESVYILWNDEMKNLVRLYFATIVLSLMMLETNYQFPILVLILTIACIFSLYPFLNNLSNKLVYDVGLKNQSKKMSLLIASNDEVYTISEIRPLRDIGVRAIQEERLSYFKDVMSVFRTSIVSRPVNNSSF